MKLIIDIDEETYNRAKNEQSIICGMNDGLIYKSNMKEAIANGTPYEERPQGEWKYICSYANTHLLRYECSKCGRTVDVYKRQELLVKYPFCHCGADMRGEEE